MPITCACPECTTKLRVPDTAAGKKVRCTKCQAVFAVPAASPPPEPPKVVVPVKAASGPEADEFPPQERFAEAADDDDEADEPKKPRKARKGKERGPARNWPMILGVGGAAAFLLLSAIMTGLILWVQSADAHLPRGRFPVGGPAPRPMPAPGPFGGGMPNVPNPNAGKIVGRPVVLVGGVFQTKGQLTNQDPADPEEPDCRYKAFQVLMWANKTYVIEMESAAFEANVRVEDRNGEIIEPQDENLEGRKFRLQVRPPRNEPYLVVATSLEPGTGPFSLTIREQGAPPVPKAP